MGGPGASGGPGEVQGRSTGKGGLREVQGRAGFLRVPPPPKSRLQLKFLNTCALRLQRWSLQQSVAATPSARTSSLHGMHHWH